MEREYLLRVIRPFVIRAARRSAATFERPYLGFDDYLSIGYVAALKALDRFKPKKGLPPNEVKALWIGFASRHIRGAMASAMRETRRRTRHEDAFLPPAFMDDYRGREIIPDFRSLEQQTAELRTTLQRFLTPDEFHLTDAHFFEGRTQAKIAAELGCSQTEVSFRWRAILRKLKNIPEFVAYLRD